MKRHCNLTFIPQLKLSKLWIGLITQYIFVKFSIETLLTSIDRFWSTKEHKTLGAKFTTIKSKSPLGTVMSKLQSFIHVNRSCWSLINWLLDQVRYYKTFQLFISCHDLSVHLTISNKILQFFIRTIFFSSAFLAITFSF